MFGLTEIKKVQNLGTCAEHEVNKASDLILELIIFLNCNKFMRLLRFLFRKKFDEQYNKISKMDDWLRAAEDSLEAQWDLCEEYWQQEAEK